MGDIDKPDAVIVNAVGAIDDVAAPEWDACAGADNPFVSHAFLSALERSGSVAPESGWAPYHLVMEGGRDGALGAVPMYLKSHSQGEFVFDHGWAAAFERAGGSYYPKLLVAVPFTPVPGPRLLVRPGPEREQIEDTLIAACVQVAEKLEVATLSINFPVEAQWRRMGEAGLLQRTGEQFHWENDGYADFEDFLARLASRKRKAIRKERRESLADGITIDVLTGNEIGESQWDAFFQFYLDTASRKWGQPYLNREFFSLLGQTMGSRVALVMARRAGRYIAGALNLISGDALYGRYWGCIEEHKFLHFEVCYYQAIEFAIQRKLARVEAGAQGPHKLSRAYLPIRTYSAHWIRDPGFRRAVERYLIEERSEVDREIAILDRYSPFRRASE